LENSRETINNMQATVKPRRSIPPPYLTGQQLLAVYTRDVASGNFTEQQLITIYGRKPWFLIHPNAAPVYSHFRIAVEDEQGRGYNFPNTDVEEVHVRLPRATPRATEDRANQLPIVGERIVLKDGDRQFIVTSVDLGGRKHPTTAILHVEWLN
jgi:hypothetical protein